MSDGTLGPQALADFMAERAVEMFCISDHDTLRAYGSFEAPARHALRHRDRNQHDLAPERSARARIQRAAGSLTDQRAAGIQSGSAAGARADDG